MSWGQRHSLWAGWVSVQTPAPHPGREGTFGQYLRFQVGSDHHKQSSPWGPQAQAVSGMTPKLGHRRDFNKHFLGSSSEQVGALTPNSTHSFPQALQHL